MKSLISRNPILRRYDRDADLVIQCDSPKDGLGACLLQKGQPIMYASRMMASAEQCYGQNKKGNSSDPVCPGTISPLHLRTSNHG